MWVGAGSVDPRDFFDVRGLTAVVTGGSGVLGGAVARGRAAAGMRVAVIGRRAEACAKVAQAFRSTGGTTLGPVDVPVNAVGGNRAEATTTRSAPHSA